MPTQPDPEPRSPDADFTGTTDQPASTFSLSLRRIEILTGILAVLAMLGTIWREAAWRPAAGVGLGAILAGINFYLIQRLAQSIGKQGETRTASGSAVGFGLRFLVLASAIFVIMRLLDIGPAPVIFGLLIPAGAVLLECIYLLIARPTSKSTHHQ